VWLRHNQAPTLISPPSSSNYAHRSTLNAALSNATDRLISFEFIHSRPNQSILFRATDNIVAVASLGAVPVRFGHRSQRLYVDAASFTRPTICSKRPKESQLISNRFPFASRTFTSSLRLEMRIATLQFAPKLGDVDGNIQRVNKLLKDGKSVPLRDGIGVDALKPDVLVLPELALTGMYSIPSRPASRSLCVENILPKACVNAPEVHARIEMFTRLIMSRLQLPLFGSNQAISRASRVGSECFMGARNSQAPSVQSLCGLS